MEIMVAAIAAIVTVLLLTRKAEGRISAKNPDPYYIGKDSVVLPHSPSIQDLVNEAASKYKISPALINAHIAVESGGDVNAENPTDPSFGLMGITPILADTYGYINDYRAFTIQDVQTIKEPANNIAIGARFLAYLHSKYPFDVATQMYNCGEKGYNNGVRVPDYLAKIKRQLGI